MWFNRISTMLLSVLLLISIGCADEITAIKDKVINNKTIEEVEKEEEIIAKINPTQEIIIPPASMPYPTIGRSIPGGGGGRRNRLPCEGGTSDCNDDNPCTIDTCNDNDECENTFDDSKTKFGSCESDGSSCTVGKCVALDDDTVVCHEQRREFIIGEIGCADDDVCTADSCIETQLDSRASVDAIGNIIPDNNYQCVQEIINGLSCFIEDSCLPGICQVMGSGMPDDDFSLQCVPNEDAAAQSFCPDTDNNQCTQSRCDLEDGCVTENVADGTPCDDNNPCSTDSVCAGGTCVGESEDCSAGLDEFCQIGFCDAADGCSSIDLTGPYGEMCETPFEGICSEGRVMCLEGENTNMCEPLIRPGDKVDEECFVFEDGVPGDNLSDEIDQDCDGQLCTCPAPPEGSTARYVSEDGDDEDNEGVDNDCTDENLPCATISHAIVQAVSGDSISLLAGTIVDSNILVDKELYIVGQGAGVSVVDANGSGGVFIINSDVTATFCGLTITGGISNFGGGIFNNDGASLYIYYSVISGNMATISSGQGGGIYNGDNTVTISNSSISGNTANDGGGIRNDGGTVTINNSTISGNTVDEFNGGGGGIRNDGGTVSISNSTISGNTVADDGGGIRNNGNSSIITISNSTIAENIAANGNALSTTGGSITLTHSIVYTSSGDECDVSGGSITDNDYNIEGGTSCGFTAMNSKQSTDPLLGVLQDNGGPTQTHALLPMSPAIDMGASDCGDMSIMSDQRGFTRPVGLSCDIGSFEVQ